MGKQTLPLTGAKRPFNPGPPTTPKGGFYGHHHFGEARKRFRKEQHGKDPVPGAFGTDPEPDHSHADSEQPLPGSLPVVQHEDQFGREHGAAEVLPVHDEEPSAG